MVLQDLGRRINAAVTNLTREQNLDEKVSRQVSVPEIKGLVAKDSSWLT